MPRCALCGHEKFKPLTRNRSKCAGCGALARTQMLGLTVLRGAPKPTGLPLIHLAPERALWRLMRERYGAAWTPSDFNPPRYERAEMDRPVRFCDLTEPAKYFEPQSVQGFMHSHVLEHVPAPVSKILSEMNAAIAPGGFHLFIVPGPFPPTLIEDIDPGLSPEVRVERFGHPEHVRSFGRDDWDDVVLSHFDGWTKVDLTSLMSVSELRAANIPAGSTLTGLTGMTPHLFIKPHV